MYLRGPMFVSFSIIDDDDYPRTISVPIADIATYYSYPDLPDSATFIVMRNGTRYTSTTSFDEFQTSILHSLTLASSSTLPPTRPSHLQLATLPIAEYPVKQPN